MSATPDVPVQITMIQNPRGQWSAQASPDPVSVKGSNQQLRFTLNAPGWSFANAEPIQVPAGGSQFPDPAVRVSDTVVTLYDANDEPGPKDFKYTIRTQHAAHGPVVVTDPTILNDDP